MSTTPITWRNVVQDWAFVIVRPQSRAPPIHPYCLARRDRGADVGRGRVVVADDGVRVEVVRVQGPTSLSGSVPPRRVVGVGDGIVVVGIVAWIVSGWIGSPDFVDV